MNPKWITPIAGGVEIEIFAVPRASRSRISGVHGDRLKVQLAAPPADGEANAALLALFVELAGVKKSAVTLVAGHGNRNKKIRVLGASVDTILARVKGTGVERA